MRKLLITIGIIFPILFAVTSLCSAQATINGCVNNAGILRILIYGESSCRQAEMPISWNVVGLQGPEGPQGSQGEQGPPGECDCPMTQEQWDDLIARIEFLESLIDRFTDMGDGTIRDNESGLIWLKDASCPDLVGTDSSGIGNWETAMAAAAVLSDGTCGLTDGSEAGDWRLPTNPEWEAFMSTVYTNPALVNTVGDSKWSEGDAFTGVQSTHYWSSTEYNFVDAWFTDVSVGNMGGHGSKEDNYYYVWPVRDGN